MEIITLLLVLIVLAALVACIIGAIKPFSIGKFALLNSRRNALIGIPVVLVGGFLALCMVALTDISAHPEKYPEKTAEAAPSAAKKPAAEPEVQPLAAAPALPKPGEAVKSGKTEITITKVSLRDKVGAGSAFEETASDGGVLVVVEYKVRNVSDKPMKSSELPDIHLVDGNGSKYSPDLGKSAAFATEADLDTKLFSDLNPDIATTEAEVFEVSKTRFDQATWLVVSEDGAKIALK